MPASPTAQTMIPAAAEHKYRPLDIAQEIQNLPVEIIPIASVDVSDSIRVAGAKLSHVRSLAELMTHLPPIVVHRPTMRVVDGRHRVLAAMLRSQEKIAARFVEGSAEDAFELGVRLNATHGLPLSVVDRRAAVARFLRSHPQWSNKAIATVVGVSDKTVESIRGCSTSDLPNLNSRIGRDGRRRPLSTSDGRAHASRIFASEPDASLRQVARAAGISVATARDVRNRLRMGQEPVPARQRVTPYPPQPRPALAQRADTAIRTRRTQRVAAPRPDTLRALANDPALRFKEEGRLILRLLTASAVGTDRWARLAESVPDHCVSSVVDVARRCSDALDVFAQLLEERHVNASTVQEDAGC
jgi:ParB-like chromosome segregation protein Spo0J